MTEHPLDQTLATPESQSADRALEVLRRLPKPLSDLDLIQITTWARRLRAERLTFKQ